MTDLADRPDVSPELRLVPHAFREAFGRSAEGVWYAPGVVGMLPDVAVCARWGAIVAGERRTDGMLELVSINKPAEPVKLPISEVDSQDVPLWARPVARVVELLEPRGATLLCSVDLPAGAGLSSTNALACATALALRDLSGSNMPLDYLITLVARCSTPVLVETAFAGHSVGVDLAGAGLLAIDTRIRREAPIRLADFPATHCPGVEELGRLLVGYHDAHDTEIEQDIVVGAALEAGAFGASMLVDEPGRPVAVLTDPARLATVRAYVSDACRRREVLAPRYLTIRPSTGAARITP